MANKEHLKIIRRGAEAWNAWRRQNPGILPELSQADLAKAVLRDANLRNADLVEANLSGAELFQSDLWGADLRDTNVRDADLFFANCTETKLIRSDLRGASLMGTGLIATDLNGADLTATQMGWTILADVDLSTTKGLETVTHGGPSTIGVDTLYRSKGHIPEVFLRGAGVPEEFITQIPALIASVKPIQFQSCFISYSHRDEEFARRLHSAMRSENLRVWFAPEDMKAGRKLHEEIFRAIQIHDKLLLVLSEHSMRSVNGS